METSDTGCYVCSSPSISLVHMSEGCFIMMLFQVVLTLNTVL